MATPVSAGMTRRGRITGRTPGRRLGSSAREGNNKISTTRPGTIAGPGRARRLRVSICVASASNPEDFIVGCGTGDVTGPIDGVGMMGYAKLGQVTRGLWQRQWARAFLVSSSDDPDDMDPSETTAIVVVDACMCFPDLKAAVLRAVSARGRRRNHPFNEANVSICATHTHAAPGGFAPFGLYNVTTGGGVQRTFDALVDGVADALVAALDDARHGAQLSLSHTAVKGAAVNRSAIAFRLNPHTERRELCHGSNEGVDETMTVLRVGETRETYTDKDNVGSNGNNDGDTYGERVSSVRGAVAWYAVHGTSLRNTNELVSGDNKGVASWLAENALRGEEDTARGVSALIDAFGSLNDNGAVFDSGDEGERRAREAPRTAARAAIEAGFTRAGKVGHGHGAVVAFPQSASGDISPNVRGARCVNDRSQPCDEVTGEASGEDGNGRVTRCAGLGPAGEDDVAGCVATGAAQAAVALEALVAPGDASPSGVVNIAGAVRHAHGWLPVGRGVAVDGRFTIDGKPGRTSSPAKGYSFAAGTTDGPGQDGFLQGVTLAGESAEGAEEGADTAVVDETRRYETQVKRWGFASAVASWALSGFKRWGVPTRVKEAHAPKPVLLHFGDVNTSEVDTREDQSWVAVDVPVQMLRIGRLLVACVPAEVTTTAGARLTRWIKETARSAASSDGDDDWEVIVTGLANGYAGYVTTPEEYVAQRYEGASTLYGQNTLGAYAQCLCELTKDVIIHSDGGSELERVTAASTTDTAVDDTPATTERNGLQGGVPPLDLRWPPWKSFGAVLESNVGAREKDSDDRGCVYSEMIAGRDEAFATFLCGRPRRDTRPPPFGTYMLVERLRDPCRRGDELAESDVKDEWDIVATDDDLNTFVEYSSAGPCGFGSRLTLRWRPPENVPSGMYRVGVRGVAKGIRKFVKNESPGAYEGYSERFLVVRPTE